MSSELLDRLMILEPDVRPILRDGIVAKRNRTYEFNLFDVTLDFSAPTARIDDVLEPDVSGTYPMTTLEAALEA